MIEVGDDPLGNARARGPIGRQAEGLGVDEKSLTDDEGKGLDVASIVAEAREIVGAS